MRDRMSLGVIVALAALPVACGGGSEAPAPPPTTAAPAAQAEAGVEEVTGVAECDAFLASYAACLESVPEEGQAAVAQAIEATKTGLRQAAQAAASAGTSDAVVAACAQAQEAAKQAMAAHSCDW